MRAQRVAEGAGERGKTGLLRSFHALAMTGVNKDTSLMPYCLSALLPKKFAFTLAEVLITLGIIGVVAAITIPNLVANYQKRTWTAQLKKSHVMLTQAFRRMLADDGASALNQTETFNSIAGDIVESDSSGLTYNKCPSSDGTGGNDFYKNLSHYIKIIDIRKLTTDDNYVTKYMNNSLYDNPYSNTAIFLLDGTIIIHPTFRNHDVTKNNKNIEMQG